MELPIDARTILNLSHGRTAAEPPAPPPGLPWEQLYAAALGQEAYVWGFPWLYLTQICWLWTSDAGKEIAKQEGLVVPWAPMNSFFHAEKLSTPVNQSGGSPNCDTLYSTAWLDLSKEHYGIHGTDEPSHIGRAESNGCIRLTNWDAARLAQMVSPGIKAVFKA